MADPGDLRLLRLGKSRVSLKEANKSAPIWVSHPPRIGKNQKPGIIARYYAQTESDFFAIINDYMSQSNLAAELYSLSSRSHRQWRFWTIIATGMLAAINVCASLALLKEITLWGHIYLPALLSGVAALYAAGLTVAGNVENFFNRGEQAAGFRETRDLLLSRYREYRSKWLYYVQAYGKTPTGSMNAGQLYRQLVDSDQELRQKIKQLTAVQGPKGGKPSSGGQH